MYFPKGQTLTSGFPAQVFLGPKSEEGAIDRARLPAGRCVFISLAVYHAVDEFACLIPTDLLIVCGPGGCENDMANMESPQETYQTYHNIV